MLGLLYTAPEKRELSLTEPDASAYCYAQQQRPSGAAFEWSDEATVQHGEPMVLRSDSPLRDSEYRLLTDQNDPSVVEKPSLNNGKRDYPRPEGRIYGHARLSDRYIAGRIDADGGIVVLESYGKLQARLHLASIDEEALRWIVHSLTPPSAPFLWGGFQAREMSKGHLVHVWQVAGSKAVSCLMRLHNYMVAQQKKARLAMELHNQALERMPEWQMFNKVSVPPKHPTRPWVAGFLDGNGSFTGKRSGASANCCVRASGPVWKLPALELLQKQYGGNLRKRALDQDCYDWELNLSPSKIKAFLDHDGIAKHLVTKRPQAYYLLGCAAMGHLRDGEIILAGLRELNSRPHRLSEMDAGLVSDLLKQVRDLPRMRQSEVL